MLFSCLKPNSIAVNSSFKSFLIWLDMGSERRSTNCKLDTLVTEPALLGKATNQFNVWLEISIQVSAPGSPTIVFSEQ